MQVGLVEYPKEFMDAVRDGKLVVFAGAGVSNCKPSSLPLFGALADMVAEGTDRTFKGSDLSVDRFLGQLESESKTQFREEITHILNPPGLEHSRAHRDLVQLFGADNEVRIVTTNFDLLFESAIEALGRSGEIECFRGPALPRGKDFSGLVHLHGSVRRLDEMVLTDADFGRAYITEGWATRFLVDLFASYTTLFVGYSHGDPILVYLARAITRDRTRPRFSLVGDKEGQDSKWENLGIQAIPYPQSRRSDFSRFMPSLGRLADFLNYVFKDKRSDVIDLAGKEPPIDREEGDRVMEYLDDPALAGAFTTHAHSPAWFPWLLDRGVLNPLFSDTSPHPSQSVLANWIANEFAVDHPDMLFLAISDHGLAMSQDLYNAILWRLTDEQRPIKTEKRLVVAQWTILLLRVNAKPTFPVFLSALAERCVALELYDSALDVFSFLLAPRLHLRPNITFYQEEENRRPKGTELELSDRRDVNALDSLANKAFAPRLESMANVIIQRGLALLAERHGLFAQWGSWDRSLDPDSLQRHAIEADEQDDLRYETSALIDLLRDSFAILMKSFKAATRDQLIGLLTSDVPLIRRIAISALGASSHSATDGTIHSLLSSCEIDDPAILHELMAALSVLYSKASDDSKAQIVSRISSAYPENDSRLYLIKDWFDSLAKTAPGCTTLQKTQEELLEQEPKLRGYENPHAGYRFWHSSGSVIGDISPWSAEELFRSNKSQTEWAAEFRVFWESDKRPDGPSWEGLEREITRATGMDFPWSLRLAQALDPKRPEEERVLKAMLYGWMNDPEKQTRFGEIFAFCERLVAAEAAGTYHDIARLLRQYADQGFAREPEVLDPGMDLAAKLWPKLEVRDAGSKIGGQFFASAFNDASGALAMFWTHSIAKLRGIDEIESQDKTKAAIEALTPIARSASVSGRYARSILVSDIATLAEADEAWVRSELLRCFESTDEDSIRGIWIPFLLYGRETIRVSGLLAASFAKLLQAPKFKDIEDNLHYFIRTAFALGMQTRSPKDFAGKWLVDLLNSPYEKVPEELAFLIFRQLSALTPARCHEWWQEWLRTYFKHRTQNKPRELRSEEALRLCLCLPYLGTDFDETCGIMTSIRTRFDWADKHEFFFIDIREKLVATEHPDSIAKLALFFEQCGANGFFRSEFSEIAREIQPLIGDPKIASRFSELVSRYCPDSD